MWFQDKLDVLIARIAIWSIRKGYGANCETSDIDDFPNDYKTPQDVVSERRCASCRAKETIDWLEKHIDLISSA